MSGLCILDIERAVCHRYGIPKSEIRSKAKGRAIARPRQLVMFLAREMTHRSLPRLGQFYGLDHTTALHAGRAIAELERESPVIRDHLAALRREVAAETPIRTKIGIRQLVMFCHAEFGKVMP